MTDEQKAKCHKIADHYGENHQMLKAVEEMAELQHALAKILTGDDGNFENVIEEIADVEIMIEQIKCTFDPTGIDVLAKIRYKLARQLERIKKEEESDGERER